MDGILIIAIVVGFIISVIGAKKLGQAVYNKTGYNAFSGVNKLLCFLIILLPVVIGIAGGKSPNLTLMAIGGITPIVILVIKNLKAKSPVYIVVLTLFQIFFGISFIMFFTLKLVIKYAFKMADFNLNVDIDTTQSAFNSTFASVKINEQAKKEANNEKAEAWAQKQGFESADAAEQAGLQTGKEL